MMEELITEEQILALTSNQKRQDFLKTWTQWPVLVNVPMLKLTVRQVVLPNKWRVVSLEYSGTPLAKYRHCYFQRLQLTDGINPFNDIGTASAVGMLKNLRMEIVKQKKGES